jgi:hypothetical protein
MTKEVHPKKRWFRSKTLDDMSVAVMTVAKKCSLVVCVADPRKTSTDGDEQYHCSYHTKSEKRVVEHIFRLELVDDHEDQPSYTGDSASAVDTTEMLWEKVSGR